MKLRIGEYTSIIKRKKNDAVICTSVESTKSFRDALGTVGILRIIVPLETVLEK